MYGVNMTGVTVKSGLLTRGSGPPVKHAGLCHCDQHPDPHILHSVAEASQRGATIRIQEGFDPV
eukprot:356133-Chlamydomonas_euryale.AAC.12